MTACYIIYQLDTGRIANRNDWPFETPMPPEGPTAEDPNVAVLHCDVDPATHRIENGAPVSIPQGEIDAATDARAMLEFRQKRARHLAATDFVTLPDVPYDPVKKAAILQQRQDSRDIPSQTTDPAVAMTMLDAIWSTT